MRKSWTAMNESYFDPAGVGEDHSTSMLEGQLKLTEPCSIVSPSLRAQDGSSKQTCVKNAVYGDSADSATTQRLRLSEIRPALPNGRVSLAGSRLSIKLSIDSNFILLLMQRSRSM